MIMLIYHRNLGLAILHRRLGLCVSLQARERVMDVSSYQSVPHFD